MLFFQFYFHDANELFASIILNYTLSILIYHLAIWTEGLLIKVLM
ncbi:hypothetical protein BACCELL_01216 [Bacteroides cellulosilyticus DSM 14838]|uniref:Uncharacterized protein n=1 Tax=Bacteroides cellulosilyticus DSM 14838 TaxID=537012 RepID=E2NAB3_9BACE|nr:hypothetical protein BACCELL_01216 [Bacteroides cellulosilyticus DSM 14838]